MNARADSPQKRLAGTALLQFLLFSGIVLMITALAHFSVQEEFPRCNSWDNYSDQYDKIRSYVNGRLSSFGGGSLNSLVPDISIDDYAKACHFSQAWLCFGVLSIILSFILLMLPPLAWMTSFMAHGGRDGTVDRDNAIARDATTPGAQTTYPGADARSANASSLAHLALVIRHFIGHLVFLNILFSLLAGICVICFFALGDGWTYEFKCLGDICWWFDGDSAFRNPSASVVSVLPSGLPDLKFFAIYALPLYATTDTVLTWVGAGLIWAASIGLWLALRPKAGEPSYLNAMNGGLNRSTHTGYVKPNSSGALNTSSNYYPTGAGARPAGATTAPYYGAEGTRPVTPADPTVV